MDKHLILLTRQDLGDYKDPIAPSFWKTVYSYIEDGWNVTIINAHKCKVDLYNYENKYWYVEFPIKYEKLSRIRKVGKFFVGLCESYIRNNFVNIAEGLLKNIQKEKKQAVIYSYEVSTVAAGKYLSQKYGYPFVTRFQGTIMYGRKNSIFNRWRFKPHFQALSTKADLVIMADDGTNGDKVLEYLGNESKILFYRNGVDFANSIERISIPGLIEGDYVLMTLSRLASWKRIDRAISALPCIIEKHPNTKLVIVGYGEEEANLKKLAKELNVSDHTIFVGQIKHHESFSYISKATVFLSLYDLSNLGNPLFEAMRCGKPIVTIDVGDTSNVIKNEENGVLLNSGDKELVADAVIRLLDNKSFADKLGENAKNYAETHFWTWDQRLSSELNEVNSLLGSHR